MMQSKTAEIFAENTADGTGYVWRWRERSLVSEAFAFYFECLDDARRHGYSVRLERAQGDRAPQFAWPSEMK